VSIKCFGGQDCISIIRLKTLVRKFLVVPTITMVSRILFGNSIYNSTNVTGGIFEWSKCEVGLRLLPDVPDRKCTVGTNFVSGLEVIGPILLQVVGKMEVLHGGHRWSPYRDRRSWNVVLRLCVHDFKRR